jgi:hypothetical protein
MTSVGCVDVFDLIYNFFTRYCSCAEITKQILSRKIYRFKELHSYGLISLHWDSYQMRSIKMKYTDFIAPGLLSCEI